MGRYLVFLTVAVSDPTVRDRVQLRQYTGHTELASAFISDCLVTGAYYYTEKYGLVRIPMYNSLHWRVTGFIQRV